MSRRENRQDRDRLSLLSKHSKEDFLRQAVFFNELDVIRILLSRKTNPNSQDEVILGVCVCVCR